MYCSKCGKENREIAEFCSRCGADLTKKNKTTLWKFLHQYIHKIKASLYERDMKIIPDNICTGDGEIGVKQYDIAILRSRLKCSRAEGRLQITNKRVLFRAVGRSITGRTKIQHEFAIDEIAGIEIRKDCRLNILNYIITVIFLSIATYLVISLFGGIVKLNTNVISNAFETTSEYLPEKLIWIHNKMLYLLELSVGLRLFAILCLVSLITTFFAIKSLFTPNLVIEIYTKGGKSPLQIRRRKKGLFQREPSSEEYTGFSEVLPAKDTEKAIKELGALITDIRTLGDEWVDKWKETE